MSIPCDVVILPSNELAEKAIAASKILEPYGALFTLELGKYYPHSSLYMLQLKDSDIDRVKEILSEIANKSHSPSLHTKRFYQAEGYIDVEFAKNDELLGLQRVVVTALNPIRDGMREKDKARMVNATGLALANLKQYGYMYFGDLYHPHISLTRLEAKSKQDVEESLPALSNFDGTFKKIGLFEMGDNGTCVRQIDSWDLK